jgi:nitrite reductase/ring-hydroxylating ferredoxin subunit
LPQAIASKSSVDTQLAIFKVRGKYYCTQQMCPHKRAFVLSDGLTGEDIKTNKLWVSCPFHKRNFDITIATFPVKEGMMGGFMYTPPSPDGGA